jgi:hypothetical protein
MRGNGISCGMGFAVAALSLAVAGTFSQAAHAAWIDAATGQPVRTIPVSSDPSDPVNNTRGLDRDHASVGGKNLYWDGGVCGTWRDSANGNEVRTIPVSSDPSDPVNNTRGLDRNHASVGGKNLFWQPCPPPSTASSTIGGGYLGGELAKNWGRVRSTETRDATGVITNQFIDSGDPLGVGIVGGYNFKPWNNNIVIGPFASFDYLNQTINHNFAGGQFLGTTTHWFINAGVKAGVVVAPGFYLYGLAGAAWLNHDLNVNFATAAQRNVTTPGFTLGLGGEYQPSSWQVAGHPISLFAQYQHTWWDNANFNTPTSSPAFNYAFRREDDTFKLGVNFYFGAAPAAPVSSPMFIKALPAK